MKLNYVSRKKRQKYKGSFHYLSYLLVWSEISNFSHSVKQVTHKQIQKLIQTSNILLIWKEIYELIHLSTYLGCKLGVHFWFLVFPFYFRKTWKLTKGALLNIQMHLKERNVKKQFGNLYQNGKYSTVAGRVFLKWAFCP